MKIEVRYDRIRRGSREAIQESCTLRVADWNGPTNPLSAQPSS